MEKWDLLDADGNFTGRTITRGEPLRAGQYHLVEHIWIVDAKGRMLIQRRAPHLRLMPGVWAVNSGSAVAGEDSESAARRELFEELSIRTEPGELVYGGRMRRRNSFTDLWILYRDVDSTSLRLQTEEVAATRWVSADELEDMLQKREFHHYGTAYFQFVFRAIERGRRTLYVSDLDGTLLQNDQTLSEYTVNTLNRLISRGMTISVATARGTIGVQLTGLNRIHFRAPLILLGGVLLYDLGRRRIVQSCEMNASTVSAVLQVFHSLGREPQLYRRRNHEVHVFYTSLNTAEESFVHRVDANGRSFSHMYHRVPYLKNSPAIFFSCQGTLADQQQLLERLKDIPGIRTTLYADTYREDNWFLEICREDADKGQAVKRLQQHLHAQRVVAFGDNRNDIPLFRAADLALCVENGTPEAKAAADHSIPANTQDGVAQYLHTILNRKM
ncbi:MAG: HAD hydrolase family protein [Clostridia bacterium]|nr:HAD hydrolase family protein [Clostridia bacterium]